MGAVRNITNAVSGAIGTDGGNRGLLQGSLQGTSDALSAAGSEIANSPLGQAAISAGAAYFRVPPTMTAALLGVNTAGQKGDLVAGLKTGLMSYGVGKGVGSMMTTTAAPTGTLEATNAAAESANAAGSNGQAMLANINETSGLQNSSLLKRLGTAFGDVSQTAGKVYDVAKGAATKVLDVVAPNAQGVDAAGKIASAGRNYTPLMLGMQAVGGAYSSGQDREAATASSQSRLDQINLTNNNAQADKAAYNASFRPGLNEIKPTAAGPLLRADGQPLYLPGGLINTSSRRLGTPGAAR